MRGDPQTGKKRKKNAADDENTIPGEFQLIIQRQFEIYLRHNGYLGTLAAKEMSKLNKYMHQACTYSRKKLKRDKENEKC